LAPFLSSLQDALQHLALHYKPVQDSSVLFGHLAIFKSLSSSEFDGSLYYDHSFDDYNPMPGTAFIQRNALTLRELHILTSLPIGITWLFTFNNLRLLNFRPFSISAAVMASSWKATLSFLKIHSCSLEFLTINGFIAPAQVRNILTSITHRGPEFMLHILATLHLDFSIGCEVLATLADALTRLRSLKLQIGQISSQSKYAATPSESFPVEGVRFRILIAN
jgi:ABC-type polysaccharide transport system permease subunit